MRDKEKQKIAQRRHYLENKSDYSQRLIDKRKLLYSLINTYKDFCQCEICGVDENSCLDFHHKDVNNKLKSVAQLCRDGVSPIKLFAEIKKCEVLCANCHRIHHANELELKDHNECSKVTLRRRDRTKWFKEYRKNFKCKHCELSNPLCLDFHHLNPSDKFMGVSEMVAFAYTEEKIISEIKKCEVLCSNCHRKETQRLKLKA